MYSFALGCDWTSNAVPEQQKKNGVNWNLLLSKRLTFTGVESLETVSLVIPLSQICFPWRNVGTCWTKKENKRLLVGQVTWQSNTPFFFISSKWFLRMWEGGLWKADMWNVLYVPSINFALNYQHIPASLWCEYGLAVGITIYGTFKNVLTNILIENSLHGNSRIKHLVKKEKKITTNSVVSLPASCHIRQISVNEKK